MLYSRIALAMWLMIIGMGAISIAQTATIRIGPQAFLAGYTVIDFENQFFDPPDVPGAQFGVESEVFIVETMFGQRVMGDFCFDTPCPAPDLSFDDPVPAIGAWIQQRPFTEDPPMSVTIAVFDANDNPLDVIELVPPASDASPRFVGFASDDGIARIEWLDPQGRLGIDNIIFGTANRADVDRDGVANAADNCPDTFNPPQADADANGVGDVCDTGGLGLSLTAAPFREGTPGSTMMGVLTRGGDVSQGLTVQLSNTAPNEVRVPSQVTFAPGSDSAGFEFQVFDDGAVDGDQIAILTVTAEAGGMVTVPITIEDDDTMMRQTISGSLFGALPAGRYEVVADLSVDPGETLEIAPGVTLAFAAGTQLLVEGTLIAQGLADAPVVFQSAAEMPAPSNWEGLVFRASGGPRSTLDQVQIFNARIGVMIQADDARVTVKNAEVAEAEVGLWVDMDADDFVGVNDVQIANSVIRDNEVGIRLDAFSRGCDGSVNLSLVAHNEIRGNRDAGIRVFGSASSREGCIPRRSGFSAPMIAGNIVRINGQGIAVAGFDGFRGSGVAKPIISSNLIIDNLGVGIVFNGEEGDGAVVQNNTIVGNEGAGISYATVSELFELFIQNNSNSRSA